VSGERALQSAPSPTQQPQRHGHRSYTIAQILERVPMSRRTFFRLRAAGELPFLEECQPRAGRIVRYRADLVDRYAAGQWGARRFFVTARKSA
jgi:hypothetical protein